MEGVRPNHVLTAALAGSADDSGIRGRAAKKEGFDDEYCRDLIARYVGGCGAGDQEGHFAIVYRSAPNDVVPGCGAPRSGTM